MQRRKQKKSINIKMFELLIKGKNIKIFLLPKIQLILAEYLHIS